MVTTLPRSIAEEYRECKRHLARNKCEFCKKKKKCEKAADKGGRADVTVKETVH